MRFTLYFYDLLRLESHILWAWILYLFVFHTREMYVCLDAFSPLQGNVKVQGMGIYFLVMPLAQTWHAKHQYKELTYEIL